MRSNSTLTLRPAGAGIIGYHATAATAKGHCLIWQTFHFDLFNPQPVAILNKNFEYVDTIKLRQDQLNFIIAPHKTELTKLML